MIKHSITYIALAALFLPCSLFAQTETTDNEQWYRVEMILFSQANDNLTESWPENPTLSYSHNWIELQDDTPADNQEVEKLADAVSNESISALELAIQNKENSGSIEQTTNDTIKPTLSVLAESELELKAHTNSISRKQGYRLLFHKGWQQLIAAEEQAPSIIIAAGEQFGDHQTLEGEIKLSVSRYLHLSTNLWLSSFELDYGQQEFADWAKLPISPAVLAQNAEIYLDEDNAPIPEFKLTSFSNIDSSPENITTDLPESTYITNEIIHIQQKRRMRSKEINYIDHPRMGIIIKILPIDAPPL